MVNLGWSRGPYSSLTKVPQSDLQKLTWTFLTVTITMIGSLTEQIGALGSGMFHNLKLYIQNIATINT